MGDEEICDCYRFISSLRLPSGKMKRREIVTEFFPVNGNGIDDNAAIEKVLLEREEHSKAGAIIGIEELDFGRLIKRGSTLTFQLKRPIILPLPKKEEKNGG